MKEIIHKRLWDSVMICLATIITSIIIAIIATKINPRHSYIESDGHNSIGISIVFELVIPFLFNIISVCFLNYVRQPLYVLLCGAIATIVIFFTDIDKGSVVGISNYIVIVIFYGMLVKDLKLSKWQIVLEGILFIIGLTFWIMAVDMLFAYDNFHNPVDNNIVNKVIDILFISIAVWYMALLTYKLLRFNKGKK